MVVNGIGEKYLPGQRVVIIYVAADAYAAWSARNTPSRIVFPLIVRHRRDAALDEDRVLKAGQVVSLALEEGPVAAGVPLVIGHAERHGRPMRGYSDVILRLAKRD
jgi:hypothetical protein